ncbi:MAG: hypothetical protein HY901_11605, partial [Deltaproteobacteria bacterium]|nr:hypothetical protein [Deltaproteobacteria bacterium]
LGEETGINGSVEALGYTHAFLFGEPRPDRPPRIFQETAFWTMAPPSGKVRLDRREHSRYAWVSAEEALQRVPFLGLKETLRRAMRAARARREAGSRKTEQGS